MKNKLKIALVHVSDPAVYGNPLALGCLKTYSESVLGDSIAVSILELGIKPSLKDPRAAAGVILAGKPSVVGFSCYIWNVLAVISICREIKKAAPAVRIMLGGADATARGASVLKDSLADILVRGEGELTFVELLSRLLAGKPWAGTPGTVVLSDGRPVEGPPRPLIENLDIIPSPYLAGLFDSKAYHYLVHETSRGCPFKCKYCVWSTRGGIRFYSRERVLKEAEHLTARAPLYAGQQGDQNIFRVFVSDQDLMMQGRRAREILRCVRSGAEGKYLRYIVHTDLRHWNRETARTADFGKFLFCFGIQSMDRRVLRLSGRSRLSIGEMQKRLDLLKKHAPKADVVFQLMMGLPGDSPEGFLKSLHWCLKACERIRGPGADHPLRSSVEIFHTAVFPNTALERDAAKFGMEWDRNPPYLIKRLNGFEEKDFERCYKVLRTIQRSRQQGGHSLIMMGVHDHMI